MILVTVKEIAAYLGVTESAVRQVVRRKDIKRQGTGHYGAALYWAADVLDHTGHAVRRPRELRASS